MGTQIRSFFANDTGDMPNNPTLPVIVYQGVFDDNSQIKNVLSRKQIRYTERQVHFFISG